MIAYSSRMTSMLSSRTPLPGLMSVFSSISWCISHFSRHLAWLSGSRFVLVDEKMLQLLVDFVSPRSPLVSIAVNTSNVWIQELIYSYLVDWRRLDLHDSDSNFQHDYLKIRKFIIFQIIWDNFVKPKIKSSTKKYIFFIINSSFGR